MNKSVRVFNAYTSKIVSEANNIRDAVSDILDYIQDLHGEVSEGILYEIKVILNELILNAMKHGNRFNHDKFVNITAKIISSSIFLIIEDEGDGHDSECFRKNLSYGKNEAEIMDICDMKETGRGLLIVMSLCDSLRFNCKGNKVIVLKKLEVN